MPFQPGHKFGKGRPPGMVSRRRAAFYDAVDGANFDVAKELMETYHEAKDIFKNYGMIYDALMEQKLKAGDPFPAEDKADKYLKIALDALKEIASYCFPKLKSIEYKPTSPVDNMSPEEKLQALKEAVKVLETTIESRHERLALGSDQNK